jgi:hypothetical protein
MTTSKNQSTPAKSAVPFGVLFGVIITFITIGIYYFEVNLFEDKSVGLVINLLNYLILPILLIFLATKNYKEKLNHGFLTLVDGLKIGVVIMLIAAIISGVFNAIYMQFFPELIDDMFRLMEENMIKENPNMSQEQLEQVLSVSKKFMSPWITIPVSMAIFSFIGLIYGLIFGTIFKKEQPHF